MTLIKTSVLSLIATIFRISYGLILYKLIAVYVGPTGVALVGQFQSVQSGLAGIATAGFGQGLTKYLAEFKEDAKKSSAVFATAVKLVGVFLLPVSIGLFFFSDEVSHLLFDTNEYHLWMQGLAISLIPASLGALFVASLNGLGEIRSLTMVGVLSSCLGIVLALVLIPLWGVAGVIAAMLATPFWVLVMSVWYLKKSNTFSWAWLQESMNSDDGRNLGKFTLMALASAITIPLSHIFIRNYLMDTVSSDAAGLWTAMWRISEAYLMVITMTLSVYYLPKMSSLSNKNDIITEMKSGYKLIMPFVMVSAFAVYLCRDWIIELLFTDAFAEMEVLFLWQFVGDMIKMASFLMGYILIAKGMAKVFIIKEVTISILFVLFTYLFVDESGLIGVTYAYVAIYIINFLWLTMIIKKYFGNLDKEESCV